jgi:hypothetical protein
MKIEIGKRYKFLLEEGNFTTLFFYEFPIPTTISIYTNNRLDDDKDNVRYLIHGPKWNEYLDIDLYFTAKVVDIIKIDKKASCRDIVVDPDTVKRVCK